MQRWLWILPLFLSGLYLLALQVAQPSPNLKPKIFVLGLSKTGTTSVGNALELLGYKRLGWKDIRSRQLVHTFINGDTSAMVYQTNFYDAFEDLPWPYLYREMAELYPDAKFILTLRKNEQTWLKSLRLHMSRGTWEPAVFFYGAHHVDEGNEERVLEFYRNHTENVRSYFADKPDRYTELVIDDGDVNWQKLCRVAECPNGKTPTVGFPKSNTAAHWQDGSLIANFHQLYLWVLRAVETQAADIYYRRSIPVVNYAFRQIWHLADVIDRAVCQLHFRSATQTQTPLPVS